jgi:fermentation-respiration switch protein FrsA (DUF1100 family)
MHGEVDQIVPFWMGKKIYEIANQPKYSHFTKFDDHMMEYDEKLLFALKAFYKKFKLSHILNKYNTNFFFKF